jgi:hypothetical protein
MLEVSHLSFQSSKKSENDKNHTCNNKEQRKMAFVNLFSGSRNLPGFF